MEKIELRMKYHEQTGSVSYLTPCPHYEGIKVGDACPRCRYFAAVTFRQQVECHHPEETVSVEAGGFSEPRPDKLSSAKKKPVQMKIKFK